MDATTPSIATDGPNKVSDGPQIPSPVGTLREALVSPVGAGALARPLEELFHQNPHLLDPSDFCCDEDDLALAEEALGCALPPGLRALLMFSDGGQLRSPLKVVQLAPVEQLVLWAEQGVIEQFGSVPFATDDTGGLLVVDTADEYGGGTGVVYRLERRERGAGRAQVHSATRLASSVGEFLQHLAEGRDAC